MREKTIKKLCKLEKDKDVQYIHGTDIEEIIDSFHEALRNYDFNICDGTLVDCHNFIISRKKLTQKDIKLLSRRMEAE